MIGVTFSLFMVYLAPLGVMGSLLAQPLPYCTAMCLVQLRECQLKREGRSSRAALSEHRAQGGRLVRSDVRPNIDLPILPIGAGRDFRFRGTRWRAQGGEIGPARPDRRPASPRTPKGTGTLARRFANGRPTSCGLYPEVRFGAGRYAQPCFGTT
jgi:hypothetical protein